MAKAKVTLADVARQAHVSVTTASMALAGRTDTRIATETADRVRQAARILGYRSPALRAHGARLPVIGFITDTVATDHYAGEMLRGGITAAAERRSSVITAETSGQRTIEAALVTDLIDRGVERFIVSAMATQVVDVPPELDGKTVVLVNCVDAAGAAMSVVPDEESGGATAAAALLKAGHRKRIWLIGEVKGGPYAGRVRFKAISEALQGQGIELDRHVACPWWPPVARQVLTDALTSTPQSRWPTAVIAMNDRVAMGVYQAAATVGLRIPDELSVVSFDNSELSWWLDPELTTVELPYFQMGRRAVEIALGDQPREHVELQAMPLHDRGSLARPRRRHALRDRDAGAPPLAQRAPQQKRPSTAAGGPA